MTQNYYEKELSGNYFRNNFVSEGANHDLFLRVLFSFKFFLPGHPTPPQAIPRPKPLWTDSPHKKKGISFKIARERRWEKNCAIRNCDLDLFFSQRQSITQKSVHAHPLTAREREHWAFAAFESFSSCEFRAPIARTPFCAILWHSPTSYSDSHLGTVLRFGIRDLIREKLKGNN